MGIARTTLVGNLTSDPRPNEAGTLCNLRVAVNDRRKVGENWEDVAGFYDVIVLGKRAETCVQYLAKGRQVAIDGKLQWREWTDKGGNKRQSVEVLANEVQFLGSKDSQDAEPAKSDDDPGW